MTDKKMDKLATTPNEYLDSLYEVDNISEEDIQKEVEDTNDY